MNSKVKNPDLVPLFEELKGLIKPYEKYFRVRQDVPGDYGLISKKEVYFVGVIIQKHYVGFYYMPIYYAPNIAKFLGPELLTRQRGKTCFYITKNDPVIIEQIEDALGVGLDLYKKMDWV